MFEKPVEFSKGFYFYDIARFIACLSAYNHRRTRCVLQACHIIILNLNMPATLKLGWLLKELEHN